MKLARNIIWNTAGIAVPLVVGIAVVPTIVRGLGTERFGFLSIVWLMIGYFSIFDLGLGRTLTKLAADRLGSGKDAEIVPLTSTALILVLASSIVVSVLIAMSAGWIAGRTIGSSPALIPEAYAAVLFLAFSLPFVLLATVLTGLLEAYQEFALINIVRLPLGVLVLVAPLVILPFSRHLGVITAALAGLRIVNAGALLLLTLRVVPGLRRHAFEFRRELVRPLVTFGGWLTVSNVVGPVMVYFDRFLIAAVMGTAAIAYYTVPYDVLTRLLVIPTAIQGVLFPAFAIMMHREDPSRVASVFERSSQTTMLLMTPALLATMLLAYEGLKVWIGADFAEHGAPVARILMVGVLANSVARIPFTFVQGAGYAKWTAMLHLFELPAYALALWILLRSDGIEGAAYAWSGRILVDTVALYVMVARVDHALTRAVIREVVLLCLACVGAAWLGWVMQDLLVRVLMALCGAVACGLLLLKYASPAIFPLTKTTRSS